MELNIVFIEDDTHYTQQLKKQLSDYQYPFPLQIVTTSLELNNIVSKKKADIVIISDSTNAISPIEALVMLKQYKQQPIIIFINNIYEQQQQLQLLKSSISCTIHRSDIAFIAQTIQQQTKAVLNEKQLRALQLKFNTIINVSNDVIVSIDNSGQIIAANPSFCNLMHLAVNELRNSSIVHCFEDVSDWNTLYNIIQAQQSFTSILKNAAAKPTWIEWNVTFTEDEIFLFGRNITERKEVEEVLRISEERFRSLVHNISDIITLIDANGVIQYQSASLKQIMGYNENELKGKTIFEIIHPDDLPPVLANFKELLTKGGSGYEATFRLLNKDGSYIYLEANGSNQLNNPAINAIVINSREITQRKKAEEEKTRLIAELSQNNKELKQFSYITSHNLRAPVTNLIALLGLIDQEPIDNDNLKTLLAGFKTSTIQLNQTLNDLINILIIKENIHQEKTHVNFKDVFESVKNNLQQLIDQCNASISDNLDTLPRIPFILPYIESIFLNLLTNALKYKQPNCTPIIRVTATITHHTATIHVADNGLGMDMVKVKDRIFGLYQRFHNHPDSKGIGLYLVQAQMHAMGGSISVESIPNVGTTFTLSFPLE